MSTLTENPVDVVVLLGSRWADLEHVPTRWQQVVRRWANRADVHSLHVVDFPRLRPGAVQVDEHASWLPGVRAWRCRVPVLRRRLLLDGSGWLRAARGLRAVVPLSPERRLVGVAATPVWAPMLPAMRGWSRVGFDAYDDWRALPAVRTIADRVTAGYDAARAADAVTVGSAELAARLAADFDLTGSVVRNGVDVEAFRLPGAFPGNLPTEPFAVYIGMVQERVDLDLLVATTQALATVVAGPLDDAARHRLEAAGVICLGAVAPALVPGLLQRAAVGIVPHVVDALTTSMDPLKIYEYRAAGLPVVATRVAGSDLDGVHVVDSHAHWADAIHRAEAEGRSAARSLRDWDDVANELFEIHVGTQTLAVTHER